MSCERITIDFETRSKSNLKLEGAYKYSLDPSTQATCLAIKERGGPVVLLRFREINQPWRKLPIEFRKQWRCYIDEGCLFCAHNAFFERCIYENVLVARLGWPSIPFRQYRCTAAKAAACALPRNLEGAGESLRLRIQKDKRGYAAMMATCKPTKRWNQYWKCKDDIARGVRVTEKRKKLARVDGPEPPAFLEYDEAPDVWNTLYEYCKIDAASEEELDLALPDLIPFEQEVWHLNQTINWRGLRCDLPTVEKIIGIMDSEGKLKKKQLEKITLGLITKPRAIKKILEFLAFEGVELPNLQKKTIEDALNGFGLSDDMRTLLEVTQALSLASVKKYKSFKHRSDPGGWIRDIVLYHAASTGRDGGTGINPYNFPRGLIPVRKGRPYAMVDNVASLPHDTLSLLYGDKLPLVFSAILRSMIIPAEGCKLAAADLSQVEVIVLWWLADNEPGLAIIRAGLDVYVDQASANTGIPYAEIPKEGDMRQLGKAQILGCGFRMSWKKFKDTAYSMYRLKLTSRQSVEAVKNYRTKHVAVTELWDAYESGAVMAVQNSGRAVLAGKCRFIFEKEFLTIQLPSGRKLYYREPEIVMKTITYTSLEEGQNGEDVEVERTSKPKPTIQFLGLDKSKKRLQTEFLHGGIITENIVQAVARDCMMVSLLELEKREYRVRLSVYDEAVVDREEVDLKEIIEVMTTTPKWAPGMPLKAAGWEGPRYRK